MSLANDPNLNAYLGVGYAFPIQLQGGKPVISNGTALIKSSLAILFQWPVGTRFFLREFGSLLNKILQEPNGPVLTALVQSYIIDAAEIFEPRVQQVSGSIVSRTDTTINIEISYRIANSNLVDSFILPFYTNVKY